MKSVKAFAPASYSNLSVGYDILGLALGELGDTIEVVERYDSEIVIKEITGADGLSKDIDKNCCGIVIQKMQQALGTDKGCDIYLHKGFKPGSGLGSSSASSVAAAVAYNGLLDTPFEKEDLIDFALEGELIACGAKHADNVAPSLFGGLVMVRSYEPLDILALPVPEGLFAVTVFPDVVVKTEDSRKLVPQEVEIKTVTKQVANMAAFVKALYEEDYEIFRNCLEDHIAEPGRKNLIPHFDEMKDIALSKGALNFGISGSGPTIFALVENESAANDICKTIVALLNENGLESTSLVEALKHTEGAYIIEK